jgi:hypothetical protein
MGVLVLALYVEGPSDAHFLPAIIQRTAKNLIDQYRQDIDVSEPIVISIEKQRKREDCILNAAKEACGFHALIVHSDADDKTPDRAYKERIEPGFNRVLYSTEKVCKELIPVIPVQMIEAWMLADYNALRGTIGTNASSEKLGLPARPALVERDANPKHTLNEIMRKANANRSHRHQKIDINRRYELLARNIDLDVLALVPSYREFKKVLTKTLAKLHFLPFTLSE